MLFLLNTFQLAASVLRLIFNYYFCNENQAWLQEFILNDVGDYVTIKFQLPAACRG